MDAATDRPLESASDGATRVTGEEQLAIPLGDAPERTAMPGPPQHHVTERVLEPSRSLVPLDLAAPSLGPAERLMRMAYRIGIPGKTIASPFSKPASPRLLATVATPLAGERMAGVALRAGHFLVHGVKAPIGQIDFASASAKLTPPFERVVHGYSWLRDLAGCCTRDQGVAVAERIHAAWLKANPKPGKAAAWNIEHAGHRLLSWLVHAPLILSSEPLRGRTLVAIEDTARWLDRHVAKADDRLGEVAGWVALVAAGLLLPDGKPRRLYAEAGLARALGELVAEDGGVLSRSPIAQMDALALLVELAACYRAVKLDPPDALVAMMNLLVPPILSLMHGEGGLGNWQGAGAVSTEKVAGLVRASGVRTRPLKDVRQWGYQRATGGKAILQFDAAPPPLPRHARAGCASTLAFELSVGGQRIVTNCGGAAFAGGQVPHRIEQGLRATAAHSTLVLDDANSTAVLIKGKLGAGVNEVEVDRRTIGTARGKGAKGATRLEASHDGYAQRFGLTHRRILVLRDDGTELLGEDVLLPAGKRGKTGKIGFAIRFHIGRGIDLRLAEDRKGAGLALPDGSLWQFRVGGDFAGEVSIEESLWVDGSGRPQPIEQLVVQGMTSRSGGTFSWLLKQMG